MRIKTTLRYVLVLLAFCLPALASTNMKEHDVTTDVSILNSSNNDVDIFATTTPASNKPKKRTKRCKCSRRFTKEMTQMIDERLLEFENKYLLRANKNPNPNEATQDHYDSSSTASRIQSIDRVLLKLNSDFVQTKETLSVLNGNLDSLRSEMNQTRGNMHALNTSFQILDKAVHNLTRLVDKVERMIPNNLLFPPLGFGEVETTEPHYPRHCDEVFQQGGMQFQGDYYIMIKPFGVARPFKVLCKMFNNSGWTVIQKRQDGAVDFFRTWQDYKQGFGNLEGEFWLGNDYIYHLSASEPTTLRIEMTDWEDKQYYAVYDSFFIDDEKQLYRIHIGTYHGNAGDSLRSHWENHDGMPFSTKDRDNDGRYYDSCAEHFHGAWWFNNCFDSHLNGKYYHKGFHKNYFQRDGIQWNTIHMYSSLKAVQMMVKPSDTTTTAATTTVVPAVAVTAAASRDALMGSSSRDAVVGSLVDSESSSSSAGRKREKARSRNKETGGERRERRKP